MPKKKARSFRCPTCRKIVLAGDPDFPFCSDRCRVIDLGKWVSGGYVISSPINDPESGGEAEYNEPRERRIGGVRKGPPPQHAKGDPDLPAFGKLGLNSGRAGGPGESSGEGPYTDQSEEHGRRKPN